MAIARLLWAYNIRSKDGKKVAVSEENFAAGFVSAPTHFDAVFEVRSQRHRKTIEEAFEKTEKDPGVLMEGVRKHMVSVGLSPRA